MSRRFAAAAGALGVASYEAFVIPALCFLRGPGSVMFDVFCLPFVIEQGVIDRTIQMQSEF